MLKGLWDGLGVQQSTRCQVEDKEKDLKCEVRLSMQKECGKTPRQVWEDNGGTIILARHVGSIVRGRSSTTLIPMFHFPSSASIVHMGLVRDSFDS
jgi:hypothetical protein